MCVEWCHRQFSIFPLIDFFFHRNNNKTMYKYSQRVHAFVVIVSKLCHRLKCQRIATHVHIPEIELNAQKIRIIIDSLFFYFIFFFGPLSCALIHTMISWSARKCIQQKSWVRYLVIHSSAHIIFLVWRRLCALNVITVMWPRRTHQQNERLFLQLTRQKKKCIRWHSSWLSAKKYYLEFFSAIVTDCCVIRFMLYM